MWGEEHGVRLFFCSVLYSADRLMPACRYTITSDGVITQRQCAHVGVAPPTAQLAHSHHIEVHCGFYVCVM